MNERSSLSVGSLVIARRTTGVCDVGERGVCDEAYSLPDGKGGRLTERRQPPAAQPLAMACWHVQPSPPPAAAIRATWPPESELDLLCASQSRR
jgi:hypothetical protein